ncbi:P-selectin-like isoform X17 [Ctenopharyngodon idella]|uniref:P-selectin-like isoform X15 n=1 Tax=Ctenopharyngodon idella TaxID=7959 RepID=UPI002230A200|nr:P-selectin-like isoform X15 [Ctenopharyngodon idella]XP_051732123.1 P-selectin-like isoform X16 [Ctenopharyngodon idella]XP_051732124.1 P-selectin-like isoform X17 [Ctenopharyngodon idella]
MSVHIGVFWLILVSVEGWTYHTDKKAMTWNKTRQWCQKHYTDIVMVHNENVTHFLTKILQSRSSTPYYWIGLQKINGNWTWVANGQIVNYQNWGVGEPNNVKTDENCVEYISNENKNGKWNDDQCEKEKYPVCHKAQCLNNSCSDRELCIEQVNNFTCVCKPGFSGPRCEKVVSCEQLSAPPHGWMECSGVYGNHSLNSTCKFSCAGGYKLRGTAELKCSSSGAWNVPPPSCAVVSCEQLSAPPHGWMECSGVYGNHSLNSTCKFSCAGGYKLRGTAELKCNSSGAWNVPPPSCAVVSCEQLSAPPHGWMECSGVYGNHSLNSTCKFSCAGGYKLRGTAELKCNSSGAWNVPPPSCAVVSCEQLSAPPHGWMECSGVYGNHSLNSTCKFSCAGGYKLRGTAELRCNSSGAWNIPPPSCAVECFPLLLFGGGLMNCTEGHDSSRSACRVQCPPGHLLLGFTEFTCRADGIWESSFPLMCASFVHSLIALLASVVVSVFCGCFCCSNCRNSKKAVRMRTQQETLNPAFEAEHTPLDGPLCSA